VGRGGLDEENHISGRKESETGTILGMKNLREDPRKGTTSRRVGETPKACSPDSHSKNAGRGKGEDKNTMGDGH